MAAFIYVELVSYDFDLFLIRFLLFCLLWRRNEFFVAAPRMNVILPRLINLNPGLGRESWERVMSRE